MWKLEKNEKLGDAITLKGGDILTLKKGEQEFSCLCFEYFFQHVSHIVSGKITLICIYQIICFYHNLIINTVDSGYCMMMTYNIRNTIYKFFRQI